MKTDDLILVSIDDHVVEPPDMFLRHVPAKYKEEAPLVVTDDKGVDQWMYQGRPQGVSGLNAVVSWPAEEWGRDPAGFAEMRPGVYAVHQRVRDMSGMASSRRCASRRSRGSRLVTSTCIRSRSRWSWCRPTTTGTSTNGPEATRAASF